MHWKTLKSFSSLTNYSSALSGPSHPQNSGSPLLMSLSKMLFGSAFHGNDDWGWLFNPPYSIHTLGLKLGHILYLMGLFSSHSEPTYIA